MFFRTMQNYYNNNILSPASTFNSGAIHENPTEPIVIAQRSIECYKLWMNKINRGGCNWNHLVVNVFVLFSVDTRNNFIICIWWESLRREKNMAIFWLNEIEKWKYWDLNKIKKIHFKHKHCTQTNDGDPFFLRDKQF